MSRVSRACDLIVGVGLSALILFTPLAFGSVEPWAIVVIETAVFFIAAAWLLERSLAGRGRSWTGLEVPIVLFVLVVGFQMVPLPRAVLETLSPRVADLYGRTAPGFTHGPADRFEDWLLAADARRLDTAPAPDGAVSLPMPLSYSVPDTSRWLGLFVVYALVFVIAADRYRDRDRLRRMIVWIVFTGVGIAILGIFQKLTWNGKILWFREPPLSTRPFGPFVNPNHFAGYMELIVPLALGLLLVLLSAEAHDAREAAQRPQGRLRDDAPRDHLGRVLPVSQERVLPWTATSTNAKATLLGFLLALAISSIVLSLSRGGFIATLATLCLFAPLLIPARSSLKGMTARYLGFVAIAVIVVGVGFWVGSSAIGDRAATLGGIKSEPSFLGRLKTWELTLDMFRHHPLFGTGLGTFQTSFLGYYPPATYGIWKQAHNDYLQLLVEVGIAGAIPVLLAAAYFFRRPFLALARDRRQPDRYLVVGLAMALVSMMLHSFVDFSLQVPAVGLLFVLIGGLLVAYGSPPDAGSGAHAPAASATERRWRFVRMGAAALLLVLAIAFAVAGARRVTVVRALSRANRAAPAAALAILEPTVRMAPGDPDPSKALGDRVIELFDQANLGDESRRREARALLDRADAAYRTAVRLTPLSSWGWWGLGEVWARRATLDRLETELDLSRLGRGEEGLSRSARLGLAALRTAVLLEPNSYQIRDELANLLNAEGLRVAALEEFQKSVRIFPSYDSHNLPPPQELPEDFYRAIVAGMDSSLADPEMRDNIADIQKELGQIAGLRRDLPEAERRYRLGLEAADSRLMKDILAALLGDMLRQEGRLDEAEPYLVQTTGSPAVGWRSWMSLGYLRAARDDHRGALAAYREAATGAPAEVIQPAILVALETARIGDTDGAVGQLRYLASARGSVEAREALVGILREAGRLDEARGEARALVDGAPDREDYRRILDSLKPVAAVRGGEAP